MTFWMTLRRSPYFWTGVFFAALAIFMSVGWNVAGAGPLPVPQHVATITLTEGVCDDTQSTWHTTLSVTANVAGGTAHISDPASPWTHAVPFTHDYTVTNKSATWTVSVYVSWPDGFVSDKVSKTAHRPESGCQPTPTTTTPPLTTVPPPPPSPVPTTVVPTQPIPSPTTSPSSSVPQPEPTPPTSAQASPSSTAHITLPVTGDDSAPLAGIAAVTALLGAGLVIVTRRRAA